MWMKNSSFENSVHSDQLASSEASSSEFTLFPKEQVLRLSSDLEITMVL